MIFASISMMVFLVIGFQWPPLTDAQDENASGGICGQGVYSGDVCRDISVKCASFPAAVCPKGQHCCGTSDSPTSDISNNRGCTLDGKSHPDGSFTPDRCMRYKCVNGAWIYQNLRSTCVQCETSSKKKENTSIKTYDVHKFGGLVTPSYTFDGNAGNYSLSQSGLETPSQLEVIVTFNYTEADESRITNVIYKETGIEVEFETGPNKDAKLLVNGTPIHPYNKMEPHSSTVGTVYISHDSHSLSRSRGGNIQIVGSQGLAVSIYALDNYAWFVHTLAMKTLETKLYGLCDVYTGGDPVKYTMQNGTLTTDIPEFIESWEIDMP